MKTCLIFLALLSTVLTAARAEDGKDKITKEQAEGIAELLTLPVRQAVKPAADKAGKDLYEALQYSNGASWALWDLAGGLAARQKAGTEPEPDPALVETYIRLRMRCNTADLCRANSNCRAYPGDGDFAKAARLAGKDIKNYAAGLAGSSPLKQLHRTRIDGFLETARKRMIFSLQVSNEKDVVPAPATPAEEAYRRKALEKRQGNRFTQPPWP